MRCRRYGTHSARTCERIFLPNSGRKCEHVFFAVATKVVQGLGKRFLGGTYIQGRAVKQREQSFSTNAAVLVVLGMDSRDDHATMAPDAFLKPQCD